MGRSRSEAGKYSNRKFKSLERRVAKEFREWTGEDFRRTPGSGGLNKSTSYKVGEKEFISDLMADRPLDFAIEVKSGVGFSLDAILCNPDTCLFTQWWMQVSYDASTINLNPLLWFKPHNNWDWIALDYKGYNKLCSGRNINHFTMKCYNRSVSGQIKINRKPIDIEINLANPFIIRWKDIKESCDGNLIFRD